MAAPVLIPALVSKVKYAQTQKGLGFEESLSYGVPQAANRAAGVAPSQYVARNMGGLVIALTTAGLWNPGLKGKTTTLPTGGSADQEKQEVVSKTPMVIGSISAVAVVGLLVYLATKRK